MGGAAALTALKRLLPDNHAQVQLLRHGEARERIANVAAYLTAPGLGSIYEPLLVGTPTFFLPPTNLTQTLQLKMLTENLAYPWGASKFAPETGGCEADFIASLFSHYIENLKDFAHDLQNQVCEFIDAPEAEKKQVRQTANEFINYFGGAGEPKAREIMLKYLNE